MSKERALETLAQGYSGHLATVSEDGFPYCIALLYLWMSGELYVHTTSARGHLRANIEKERRVCLVVDEQEGVFDYGRFECDSGLAYRSVCLFGRIRIVEDRDVKQRFILDVCTQMSSCTRGVYVQFAAHPEIEQGNAIGETVLAHRREMAAVPLCKGLQRTFLRHGSVCATNFR